MKSSQIIVVFSLIITMSCQTRMKGIKEENKSWTLEKAQHWSTENGWLRGSNFNPSTAINQLETWQAESFDTATINRELGWAQGIGLNVMRV
jgi:hypothetical protein